MMPGLALIKKESKMVSERKRNIPKIDTIKCCNKIMETEFCPHCGTPKDKIVNYPQRFIISFYTKERVFIENNTVFLDTLGISQKITIEYELTEKNGDVNLISLSDGIDQFRLVKFGVVDSNTLFIE